MNFSKVTTSLYPGWDNIFFSDGNGNALILMTGEIGPVGEITDFIADEGLVLEAAYIIGTPTGLISDMHFFDEKGDLYHFCSIPSILVWLIHKKVVWMGDGFEVLCQSSLLEDDEALHEDGVVSLHNNPMVEGR